MQTDQAVLRRRFLLENGVTYITIGSFRYRLLTGARVYAKPSAAQVQEASGRGGPVTYSQATSRNALIRIENASACISTSRMSGAHERC